NPPGRAPPTPRRRSRRAPGFAAGRLRSPVHPVSLHSAPARPRPVVLVYNGSTMRSPRRLLIIVAAYTALCLFIAGVNALTYMPTGGQANWRISIERSLAEWYLWALVTPAILWLAKRRPITRRTVVGNGSIHLVAMVLVGIAKAIADQYVRRLL